MFKDFDEILRGFTSEEFALSLHKILVSYLDSIGVLNKKKYYKYLDTNIENTVKDIHKFAKEYQEERIKKFMKGDK